MAALRSSSDTPAGTGRQLSRSGNRPSVGGWSRNAARQAVTSFFDIARMFKRRRVAAPPRTSRIPSGRLFARPTTRRRK